jgi:hypothetical protein
VKADRRGIRYAVVGLLLGIFVLLVLWRVAQTAQLVAEIRHAQQTNTKTLDNSHETLRVIEDCTQPAGTCYRRGQSQTASAVSSINRVVVLAAACSVGLSHDLSVVQRQQAIQSCVISRLATHKP